jgi:SAM-dependent methyltransferase
MSPNPRTVPRSASSEQRAEDSSDMIPQHPKVARTSDYTLHTRTQRLVGMLLYFHHREITKLFRSIAEVFDRPGRVVVEIGAGRASKAELFSRALYVSTDFTTREGIDLVTTGGQLAFRDHSVDLVICMNVIEHVYDPECLLEETHRLLRRGGCLFLVTPFLFPLHDIPYDFFRYTEYSLKRLLNSYSKVHIHRIQWLPLPKRLFERFVLYYVCVAKTD